LIILHWWRQADRHFAGHRPSQAPYFQKASGTMRRHCAQLQPIVSILRLMASRRIALRPLAVCCALFLLSAVGPESTIADGLPDPPVIQNFVAVHMGTNMWCVEGNVVCSDPAYLQVVFGGLLDGFRCATDADGNFYYGFWLTPGHSGYVTAQATDHDGQQSQIANAYILND
jgi:hypothetical protein